MKLGHLLSQERRVRMRNLECHTMLHTSREDRIHKMIHHDELGHSCASNVAGFPAARILLGHCGTWPGHALFTKEDSQPGWLCYVVQQARKMPKMLRFVAVAFCCMPLQLHVALAGADDSPRWERSEYGFSSFKTPVSELEKLLPSRTPVCKEGSIYYDAGLAPPGTAYFRPGSAGF